MTGIGEQSEMIVEAIIKHLYGRNGLGNAFDEIDADTRFDIEDELRLIVRRILERP